MERFNGRIAGREGGRERRAREESESGPFRLPYRLYLSPGSEDAPGTHSISLTIYSRGSTPWNFPSLSSSTP